MLAFGPLPLEPTHSANTVRRDDLQTAPPPMRQGRLFADVPIQPKKRPQLEEHRLADEERRVRIRERDKADAAAHQQRKLKEKVERSKRLLQKKEQDNAAKKSAERIVLLEYLHESWAKDYTHKDNRACATPFTSDQMRAVDHLVASDGPYAGDVPYANKEDAKLLGAKWNGDLRCWCAPSREIALDLMTKVDWRLVHLVENCQRVNSRAPLVAKADPIPTALWPWTLKQFQRAHAHCYPASSTKGAQEQKNVATAGEASPASVFSAEDFIASVRARRNSRDLDIPDDDPADIEELALVGGAGVPELAAHLFDGHQSLGPHASISNVRRLLRAFRLNILDPHKVAFETQRFLESGGTIHPSDLYQLVLADRR